MTTSTTRIMAVDPGMQYVGIAIFEGDNLLWYGVRTFPGHDVRSQIKQYLTSLLQQNLSSHIRYPFGLRIRGTWPPDVHAVGTSNRQVLG